MPDVIPDLPRVHTAIAEWLGCILYLLPMKKRFKGVSLYALYFVFLILLLFTNIVGERVPISLWLLFMLMGMAAMFLMIHVCSCSTVIESGYYWTRAFLVAEFAASLEWQIYYYYALSNGYRLLDMTLCMALVYFLVFGGMYLLETKRIATHSTFKITRTELIGSLLIAFIAFAISNLNFALQGSVFTTSLGAGVLYVRTLVDIAGLVFLFAHEEQRREISLHYELEAMDNLFNRQYEQYQQFLENNESIRRIYHDLKHQIAFIRAEKDEQRRDNYLAEMDEVISIHESKARTGSSVLDTLITSKNLACLEKGIKMTCYADAKQLELIDVMDICSIFGNALDNAIEYEETIRDVNKRLIKVTAYPQNRFLMIRIENYCEEQIVVDGEIPGSTKKDQVMHGYGIKSIKRAVEKYGGHLSMGHQDNWFFITVLIPLPELTQ